MRKRTAREMAGRWDGEKDGEDSGRKNTGCENEVGSVVHTKEVRAWGNPRSQSVSSPPSPPKKKKQGKEARARRVEPLARTRATFLA